jgi:hypothetical protein
MGMTTNNNYLNYKLHQFLGDFSERKKLFELYLRFSERSVPLPIKAKTVSSKREEWVRYFNRLIETKLIIYARNENTGEFLGFVAFDLQLKSLNTPQSLEKMIQQKPQSQYCEFVFAASESSLLILKNAVADIFQLLKSKYGVQYIVGNVNREHKKEKYIKTIQRIFGFKVFQDFAIYEIP